MRIPVFLRPVSPFGRKEVQFVVETDSERTPVWRFSLSAQLYPAWEIQDGAQVSVLPGETAVSMIHAVARRKADKGLDAPVAVEGDASVQAELNGQWKVSERPGGPAESAGDIRITMQASDTPGVRRGNVFFRWPDGSSFAHVVRWEIKPILESAPSGLVLRKTGAVITKSIMVKSGDGAEFHITGLAGPIPVRISRATNNASSEHKIEVDFDTSKIVDKVSYDIKILTDHPKQAAVLLTVIAIP